MRGLMIPSVEYQNQVNILTNMKFKVHKISMEHAEKKALKQNGPQHENLMALFRANSKELTPKINGRKRPESGVDSPSKLKSSNDSPSKTK
jgi:hypothetical protein